MKKLWLLLVVIALGGCSFSGDGSREYEQTVVNSSKYTVLCKNIKIEPNTTVKVPVTVGFNSMSADELTFSYEDAEYPRVQVSKERIYKNLQYKYTISNSQSKSCTLINTSNHDVYVLNNYFESEYKNDKDSSTYSFKKEISKPSDDVPYNSITTVLYNYEGTVNQSDFSVYYTDKVSVDDKTLTYDVQTQNFVVDNYSSEDTIYVIIYD